MAQTLVNVSEDKRDLLKIVRSVSSGEGPYIILKNGKPIARLCGVEDDFTQSETGDVATPRTISRAQEASSGSMRPKKSAFGILSGYANESKRRLEPDAWRKASEEKHARTA